jgi:hypothetical protein
MIPNGFLGSAAALVTFVAALGSVALQLYAGRHSPQHLVLVLIAGWVLSPFVILALLHRQARRWPAATRTTLFCLMLAVSLGSLAIYGAAVARPLASRPPAFLFVAVPPASLLLAVAMLAAVWLIERKS